MGNLPPRPCPKHSGTQGHGFIISDGPQRSPGAVFSSLTVPAKTPAAPSVLFIKYTVQLFLFVCVCVWYGCSGVGVGLNTQGWETHVTVALWVFVIGTACLVRPRGHSQLLGCSSVMWPEPIPPEQPWPHKQDASDVQLNKCGRQIPVQYQPCIFFFFRVEFHVHHICLCFCFDHRVQFELMTFMTGKSKLCLDWGKI